MEYNDEAYEFKYDGTDEGFAIVDDLMTLYDDDGQPFVDMPVREAYQILLLHKQHEKKHVQDSLNRSNALGNIGRE